MSKTIIIHDDRIEVLRPGYNIIDKTFYSDNAAAILAQALTFARDELDMDNMDAVHLLGELIEVLQEEARS